MDIAQRHNHKVSTDTSALEAEMGTGIAVGNATQDYPRPS